MQERTRKVNMLTVVAILVCAAAANAAPDNLQVYPCRDQNYSLLVDGEPVLGRKPVRIFEMPKADYPEEAHQKGISGTVVLSVRFLAAGRIGSVEVVSGRPGGLTEAAVRAARLIRFLPARQDGRLINTAETVEYHFADPRRCSLD